MFKILEANIKTIDEKNHIRFHNKDDIKSIVFKSDVVKKETEEKIKDTKTKDTKKTDSKKSKK